MYLQEFTYRIEQFVVHIMSWQAAPHGISKNFEKCGHWNIFLFYFIIKMQHCAIQKCTLMCTIKKYANLCVELNQREKQKTKPKEPNQEKERNHRRKL